MSLIIVIQNVTELAEVSDYKYQVLVTTRNTVTGEIGERPIAAGDVKQHPRIDGWEALVRRLLEQRSDARPLADWIADIGNSAPDRFLRVLGTLTADRFERMADGQMNLMVMLDREFARRFPAEYARWDAKHDR